jgi:hypothetical protein
MPYVQVAPESLVVGQEYVLTRKGLKPRVNAGLEHEVRNVPAYKAWDPSRPAPLVKATVVKKPETVVIPPTSKKALEDAYRALQAFKQKDASYAERDPLSFYGSKKPKYNVFKETDYLMRAFYAGSRGSSLVFSQHRSFGSKKPVEYHPINVNELGGYNKKTLVYHGLSAEDWAFWQLQVNNGTRRNNAAVGNNGTRRNVPMGNLLGLNNAPRPPRNNRTANQALNNLTKKHLLEQNLKGLF